MLGTLIDNPNEAPLQDWYRASEEAIGFCKSFLKYDPINEAQAALLNGHYFLGSDSIYLKFRDLKMKLNKKLKNIFEEMLFLMKCNNGPDGSIPSDYHSLSSNFEKDDMIHEVFSVELSVKIPKPNGMINQLEQR